MVVLGGVAACRSTPAAEGGATTMPDGANATVVRVIDGDTIEVDLGGALEPVRLLGIDTPEVARAATDDRPAVVGECFAAEASAFTSQLLPRGAPVRLERDVVPRDHYGRLLAHVFVGVTHVNVAIVAQGFAAPLFIEPNGVHRASIVAAASDAEAAGRGLWAACS